MVPPIKVTIDETSSHSWDEFQRSAPGGHLLQTWAWGELKGRFGWVPRRVAVHAGGQMVAAAQVLFRPLAGLSVAYVPKGPVFLATDDGIAYALLAAIHRLARHSRAIYLKVEPDWEEGEMAHRWWRERGFVPSAETVQPRRTVIVSLRPDEGAILAQMKPKTRYNVRLAERKGVVVRPGDATNLADFARLMEITGQRDGFSVHSPAYYKAVWELFAPRSQAQLFIAEYEGRPLAALMVFAFGRKAYYMYGGSSNEERQRMPNHLLQWTAMRWAREQGCEFYDLWGVPDYEYEDMAAQAKREDDLPWGLYRFKFGFGGRVVRYIGAYDYVYIKPLYALWRQAWAWRRRL
ncbi:MAG: peptidoglycan bridge formation glycyltransferase FemA/FemB family protein [Chloroflexi bacterium]|nr:peptidoglycan bridge formation glycyltransferase FemA/FemB family protein [Chloroflexota bacterium]